MGDVVEPTFRSSVTRRFGDEARAWLAALPALEADLAVRWGLVLGPEMAGGRLASVRVARRTDGTEAVLKLAGPWDRPADEIACLRLWDGGPAPRLLEADAGHGALLLERVLPGTPAVDAPAGQVEALLEGIQLRPPAGLPPLHAVVRLRLERAALEGRASKPRLDWARVALERLEEGPPGPVTVHGDFDERSILRCERRGLCAIDPLPCAGDGAYDAASWIHANRRPGRRARFEAMAAAGGFDRERLRDWCAVVAVHG